VTVVDACHLPEHLGQDGHADEQIAYADLLVVNKVDLVSEEELRTLEDTLAGMNGDCARVRAQDARVPMDQILNIGGFDLKRIAKGVGGCAKTPMPGTSANAHAHEIQTVSVAFPGEIDGSKFQAWLEDFVGAHAEDLFRSKGLLALRGVAERMVFQGVHGMFRMSLGEPWVEAERQTQAVFIGRNLRRDEILASLESFRV
jgi:G3E family GTPase